MYRPIILKGRDIHSFVFDGEEYFVIYHAHQSTDYYGYERFIHADRITFREVNGETVMVANGPSRSLQWLPEVAGEYSNIASKATVSVSSGTGKEYLNDGVIPYYAYNETQVLSTDTDVTVTLRFEKPVTVVSVMVFNAFNEFDAFLENQNDYLRSCGAGRLDVESLRFCGDFRFDVPCDVL